MKKLISIFCLFPLLAHAASPTFGPGGAWGTPTITSGTLAGTTINTGTISGGAVQAGSLSVGGNSVTLGGAFQTVGTFYTGGNFDTGGTFTTLGTFSTASAFTTLGAFPLTMTVTGATDITLPVTGALATVSQVDAMLPLAGGTVTGSVLVNGNTTLGDASGDTATINAGTVTAANATDTSSTRLANVGALDDRYASLLSSSGGYNFTSNFSGADTSSSNGSATASMGAIQLRANSASASNYGAGDFRLYAGTSRQISWDAPLVFAALFYLNGDNRGTVRVHFGSSSAWTNGAANQRAVGISISGTTVTPFFHDGSSESNATGTGTVAISGTNWDATSLYRIVIASDGAGGISWALNGSAFGSTSGGPSSNTSDPSVCAEARSAASATTVSDIFILQSAVSK